MAKKKKTVTPVIMGIRPQGKKKLLALHFHPDAIRENVKGLVEMSAEQKELQPLFEDIQVLVNWALDETDRHKYAGDTIIHDIDGDDVSYLNFHYDEKNHRMAYGKIIRNK